MKNWSTRTRIFIGAMLFAVLITISLISVVVWQIGNKLSQPIGTFSRQAPDEINDSRTLIGSELFSKTEFFKQSGTTYGDILYGPFSEINEAKRELAATSTIDKAMHGYSDAHYEAKSGDLTLLGKFGVQVIGRDGLLVREFLLEPTVTVVKIGWYEQNQYKQDFDEYRIIDLENDGKLEFLAWGGMGGISVFDAGGKKTFQLNKRDIDVSVIFDKEKFEEDYKKFPTVQAAATGDLDGDGIAEIIYTTSNDEIIAVDRSGKEVWRQTSEVPGSHLWTFDIDNDSRSEIVELFFSIPLLRASDGKAIREFDVDYNFNDEIFLADIDKTRKFRFAGISSNQLMILDEENHAVFKGDAPLSTIDNPAKKAERKAVLADSTPIDLGDGTRIEPAGDSFGSRDTDEAGDLKMAWIGFRKDEKKYLAAGVKFWEYDRSLLYVYSPNGKLIYHEILPEQCRKIIAVSNENGTDDFLVVGKDTVWRYHPNI